MALQIRLLVVLFRVTLFLGACFPSFSGAIRIIRKSPDVNLVQPMEEFHPGTHSPGAMDSSVDHRSLRGTRILDFSAFTSEEIKDFNADYTPSHPNYPDPHDGSPPPPRMHTEVTSIDDIIDCTPASPNLSKPHDGPPPPQMLTEVMNVDDTIDYHPVGPDPPNPHDGPPPPHRGGRITD